MASAKRASALSAGDKSTLMAPCFGQWGGAGSHAHQAARLRAVTAGVRSTRSCSRGSCECSVRVRPGPSDFSALQSSQFLADGGARGSDTDEKAGQPFGANLWGEAVMEPRRCGSKGQGLDMSRALIRRVQPVHRLRHRRRVQACPGNRAWPEWPERPRRDARYDAQQAAARVGSGKVGRLERRQRRSRSRPESHSARSRG